MFECAEAEDDHAGDEPADEKSVERSAILATSDCVPRGKNHERRPGEQRAGDGVEIKVNWIAAAFAGEPAELLEAPGVENRRVFQIGQDGPNREQVEEEQNAQRIQ